MGADAPPEICPSGTGVLKFFYVFSTVHNWIFYGLLTFALYDPDAFKQTNLV